jgi:hypothetical protein
MGSKLSCCCTDNTAENADSRFSRDGYLSSPYDDDNGATQSDAFTRLYTNKRRSSKTTKKGSKKPQKSVRWSTAYQAYDTDSDDDCDRPYDGVGEL